MSLRPSWDTWDPLSPKNKDKQTNKNNFRTALCSLVPWRSFQKTVTLLSTESNQSVGSRSEKILTQNFFQLPEPVIHVLALSGNLPNYFSCNSGINIIMESHPQHMPTFLHWTTFILGLIWIFLLLKLIVYCFYSEISSKSLRKRESYRGCLLQIWKALFLKKFLSSNYLLFLRSVLLAYLFSNCGFIDNTFPNKDFNIQK